MDLVTQVKRAGVVGAGGAGFPAHIKLSARADMIIANGMECEPLLFTDQFLMSAYAGEIVAGIRYVMEATGAGHCYIALKKHYHEAVSALNAAIGDNKNITLFRSDTWYPAGDERQIIFEITGKVVPAAGIPLDLGIVVLNVGTLAAIAKARDGLPVTERFVTVGGAVGDPAIVSAPIGTPFSDLIRYAGGAAENSMYIEGGPLMGKVHADKKAVVSKTTNGIVALPENHPLILMKTGSINLQLIKSVCCQCTMCTQMCPRNSLGLGTAPNKAMLSFAYGTDLISDRNSILSCSDCGICSYYACNFGLKPALVMSTIKNKMNEMGIKPETKDPARPDASLYLKRIPTYRIITRTGLSEYDRPAKPGTKELNVREVDIPLKQHIGVPSVPVVSHGQRVEKGDLIAEIPEGKLGARVHASISGTVKLLDENAIRIEA